MAKKTEFRDLEVVESELETAKKELYKVVADAKLGEPQFEVWRKKCLELSTERDKILKSRSQALKELGNG